jgi:hypothetical protein
MCPRVVRLSQGPEPSPGSGHVVSCRAGTVAVMPLFEDFPVSRGLVRKLAQRDPRG